MGDPNEASAVRLIGALLAEQHETWVACRYYFDMEIYWQWRRASDALPEATDVVKNSLISPV